MGLALLWHVLLSYSELLELMHNAGLHLSLTKALKFLILNGRCSVERLDKDNRQNVHLSTLVVVAFLSLARTLGECATIHSPPALFFF